MSVQNVNICGIVVHLAPERTQVALDALAALPGVEIVGHAEEGRVALTAIDTETTLALDQLTAFCVSEENTLANAVPTTSGD